MSMHLPSFSLPNRQQIEEGLWAQARHRANQLMDEHHPKQSHFQVDQLFENARSHISPQFDCLVGPYDRWLKSASLAANELLSDWGKLQPYPTEGKSPLERWWLEEMVRRIKEHGRLLSSKALESCFCTLAHKVYVIWLRAEGQQLLKDTCRAADIAGYDATGSQAPLEALTRLAKSPDFQGLLLEDQNDKAARYYRTEFTRLLLSYIPRQR